MKGKYIATTNNSAGRREWAITAFIGDLRDKAAASGRMLADWAQSRAGAGIPASQRGRGAPKSPPISGRGRFYTGSKNNLQLYAKSEKRPAAIGDFRRRRPARCRRRNIGDIGGGGGGSLICFFWGGKFFFLEICKIGIKECLMPLAIRALPPGIFSAARTTAAAFLAAAAAELLLGAAEGRSAGGRARPPPEFSGIAGRVR